MMWYRCPGPRRRMRRFIGIPFIFPLLLIFSFHGHSFDGLFSSLVSVAILFFVVNLLIRSVSRSTTNSNQQQQQYYQPPQQYYQPSQQYYQPPEQREPSQQSYEQGYRSAPEAQRAYPENQPQESSSYEQYEQYEQPQVQYPEQMPPM